MKLSRHLILPLLAAAASPAIAGVKTWVGATNSSWNTAGSWGPSGVPAGDGSDSILFSAAGTIVTTLDNSFSISGLSQTGGSYTINNGTGTNTLTIGTGGISIASGTHSFNAAIIVGGTESWTHAGGNTLTFGAVNVNGQALTLGNTSGGGSIAFTGALTGNASSSITYNRGVNTRLTLSSASNSYSGSIALTQGGLAFGSATALSGVNKDNITVAGTYVTMIGAGYAIDNSFLQNAFSTTSGTATASVVVGLGVSSSNNLDFSGGTVGVPALTNASLGAYSNSTYSGTLTAYNNAYRLGGGGATLTVTSNLNNASASLTINGSVILTPSSGTNAFAGTLTINNATLTTSTAGIGSASAISLASGATLATATSSNILSSAAVTILANTPTLTPGSGQSITLNGAFTGGTFTDNGTGTLNLGGATDNLNLIGTLNSGTVNLGKSSTGSVHALYGATIGGATVKLGGTGGDQIADTGTVTLTTGTFDLNGASETVSGITANGGTTSALATITNTGGSASTLTIGSSNGASTIYSAITAGSGGIALTKIGTGTASVANANNTYTGTTTVTNGTLKSDFGLVAISSSGTLTNVINSSSALSLGGGTMNVTGRSNSSVSSGSVNTAATTGATFLTLASITNLQVGQVVSAASGLAAGTYIVSIDNGNKRILLSTPTTGALTVSTALTFTTPTFTTSQSFASTAVTAGSSAVTGTLNGGTSVTVNLGAITTRTSGSTLDFTLPASGSITTTTSNANFSGGAQTILGGYATVGAAGWAVTAASTGGSPTTITSLATYSSTFTASADVDVPLGANATGGSLTINSLRFSLGGASVNTAGDLTIATGGILSTFNVAANTTSINNNSLTSGNGTDLIVIMNTPNVMTIGSNISDNGGTSIGLTKSGPGGNLTLTNANTFTGETKVNSGTLTIGNSLALQYSTYDTQSAVTPTGAVSFGAQTAATFGGLKGAKTLVLANNSAAAVALKVGNNNGDAVYSGVMGGIGSLEKVGSGSLTLSGTNSYTGITTVTQGTLLVTGSLSSSSAVSVNGGTLGGNGNVAGSVNVASNAHIAPGTSIGTLTTGAMTLNNASQLDYELGASGTHATPGDGDLIAVLGNLTLDGQLNITGLTGFAAGSYRLFTYTGSLTDNGLLLPSYVVGSIDTTTNGVVFLDVTATPEPASLSLIGLAGTGLLARRRGNRRVLAAV